MSSGLRQLLVRERGEGGKKQKRRQAEEQRSRGRRRERSRQGELRREEPRDHCVCTGGITGRPREGFAHTEQAALAFGLSSMLSAVLAGNHGAWCKKLPSIFRASSEHHGFGQLSEGAAVGSRRRPSAWPLNAIGQLVLVPRPGTSGGSSTPPELTAAFAIARPDEDGTATGGQTAVHTESSRCLE